MATRSLFSNGILPTGFTPSMLGGNAPVINQVYFSNDAKTDAYYSNNAATDKYYSGDIT